MSFLPDFSSVIVTWEEIKSFTKDQIPCDDLHLQTYNSNNNQIVSPTNDRLIEL